MYEDEIDWADERLHAGAVRKLVELHREEYDQLRTSAEQERIAYLEKLVGDLTREIKKLKERNPKGTNVPALEETIRQMEG